MTAFACAIVRSSSPTSSGRITRCEEKYGARKQPIPNTIASRSGKLRSPAPCSTGRLTISGTRAMSPINIVRRAPRCDTSVPLGMPRSATGNSSTARTTPMRVGDPVVTRTNQGRARNVICEPSDETLSATISARSPGLRNIADEAIRPPARSRTRARRSA
jgi:hypothetical protein